MAEQSGFFNANLVNGEFDRVYLAEHFAKYFASFIGNGVFGGKSNELMVTQATNSGMKVEVLSGMGWINGFWYENDSNLSLDISVADGVLNRIDNIVLRLGRLEREIKLEVIRGTPASNAVAPALRRDNDYYDLKLAEVSITAGKINITQADITDTRLNSEVCGFVVGVVKQFDTQEFGRQIDGYIANFTEEYNNHIANFVATYKAYAAEYKAFLNDLELNSVDELESLFAKLNELAEDESALTSLGLDVYNNKNDIALLKQTIGYTKKNLIPYPFNFTTRVSNGITWTDNGDGTITANGTATESTYFTLYRGKAFEPGKYLVSSNADLYGKHFSFIRFINRETSLEIPGTTYFGFDNIPIEITETNAASYDLFVGLSISKGTTVSNLIFQPMVRKAEIIDGTWKPYRPSVLEIIQEDAIAKGCFYRINRFTGIKEWLNAPNIPGIEYCLTERWNNKPVYQYMIFDPTLPVTPGVESIDTNLDFVDIISVTGIVRNKTTGITYPTPAYFDGEPAPALIINKVTKDGWVSSTITKSMSNHEMYITIKYTKS